MDGCQISFLVIWYRTRHIIKRAYWDSNYLSINLLMLSCMFYLKVEVRVREGRAVNIHMFCARRPGLLLSTMRALDGLGLDIQQAVISCFNGFALDVFRAEVCSLVSSMHRVVNL